MSRHGIVSHSYKAVFFWSPKAACSSLFQILLEQDEFSYILQSPDNYRKGRKLRQLHGDTWQNVLKPIQEKGYKSVILARDPTDRIVSGFINKFVNYPRGAGALTHARHLESFSLDLLASYQLRQIGQKYGTVPAPLRKLGRRWFMRGSMRNNLSFDQFLDQVAHEHRTRSDPDLPSIDGHWDTQVPPGLLSNGFRYDHIVRMEKLSEDWKAVSEDIGVPPFNKHLNQSPNDGKKGPPAGQNTKPRISLRSDRLTEGQLSIIRELYEVDYRSLGYDIP